MGRSTLHLSSLLWHPSIHAICHVPPCSHSFAHSRSTQFSSHLAAAYPSHPDTLPVLPIPSGRPWQHAKGMSFNTDSEQLQALPSRRYHPHLIPPLLLPTSHLWHPAPFTKQPLTAHTLLPPRPWHPAPLTQSPPATSTSVAPLPSLQDGCGNQQGQALQRRP